MAEALYRMYAAKQMRLRLINLRTGGIWRSVGASGHILKGRGGRMTRKDEAGRRIQESDEQFFWGELYCNEISTRVTVVPNPTLPSSGYEIALGASDDYPARQEFTLYVVVQFELPWVARWRYGAKVSRLFAMGNRLEDPIRVQTDLEREWGLDPDLEYQLQGDEIPLWPWSWGDMDFHSTNPVTGGPAIPAGYVLKDGDHLRMLRTWRKEDGTWVRR